MISLIAMALYMSMFVAGSMLASADTKVSDTIRKENDLLTVTFIPSVLEQLNAKTHFGDPSDGCLPDEIAIQVQGVPGGFCSPKCKSGACPRDIPAGATAHSQCILKAASGEEYCALTCFPKDSCGDSRATCKPVQGGFGLCTYNS